MLNPAEHGARDRDEHRVPRRSPATHARAHQCAVRLRPRAPACCGGQRARPRRAPRARAAGRGSRARRCTARRASARRGARRAAPRCAAAGDRPSVASASGARAGRGQRLAARAPRRGSRDSRTRSSSSSSITRRTPARLVGERALVEFGRGSCRASRRAGRRRSPRGPARCARVLSSRQMRLSSDGSTSALRELGAAGDETHDRLRDFLRHELAAGLRCTALSACAPVIRASRIRFCVIDGMMRPSRSRGARGSPRAARSGSR